MVRANEFIHPRKSGAISTGCSENGWLCVGMCPIAGITAHPPEIVFEKTALAIGIEFLMHVHAQAFTLSIQLLNQSRVMLIYIFEVRVYLGSVYLGSE
jgi:hypothetical protein